jgi:hypothetical protein
MMPKFATFHDSEGGAFEAPSEVFILEHNGSAVDETDSTPLAYFYDQTAAQRELARLVGLEFAVWRAERTAERDRVTAQVAVLTAQEKANLDLAEHAHRAGKGERRATRARLLAAGVDPDRLFDPRPYLRQLELELATDAAAFAERHSVYSVYAVAIDPSDTVVEDPNLSRGY